jgi:hypothetical protein
MFDAVVRYTAAKKQKGWASAGDFRPCRRREVVDGLINLAAPIFHPKRKLGTLQGEITIHDPNWWKPMTDMEVDRFLEEGIY